MLRTTLIVAVLATIAVVLGCGNEETPQASSSPTEETPQASSSPREESTPVPTQVPTATTTPEVTPGPTQPASLPPIPADWPTYDDPKGLFSIRYPSSWFEIEGDFYATDLGDYRGPSLRPGTVKVEVNRYDSIGSSGCGGGLRTDPRTGEASPEPGATEVTLGGLPAWQIVRGPGEGAGGTTRIQGISLIYKGSCVLIAAYFTQEQPDVTTFLQMASTFEFKS